MTGLAELRWVEVGCALCAGARRRRVARSESFPVPLGIWRCRDCGHVYLSPRPADEDLPRLYDEDYYTGDADYVYADDRESPEVAALRANARLHRIREIVPAGRLLEVGCSFGAFLFEARETGFEVSGVDLSPVAVEHCRERGLDVARGTLETKGPADPAFDVIYLSETIEHLPDPRATVRAAAAALAPGGLLVVGTGNHASLARVLRGNRWGYYMPGHLQYFSARSLSRLLGEEGLEVVRRRFGDDRPLGARRAIRRKEGRPAGPLAVAGEIVRAFHVGGFSLGAGMIIYARKEPA